MRNPTAKLLGALLSTVALSIGCSDSEAPAEDHTPVAFTMAVNGTIMPDDTLRLNAGATDTVQITFYNAANDNLDDAEAEHYSLLTFTPATGIAATRESSHHFRHDVVVTATAGTTGTLEIGFGHDALADEHSFAGLVYKIQ
jgi:hypothetical protein